MKSSYVHGYQGRENERLQEQAAALTELLHHDTLYPAGSSVLEVGCGVGAQTLILAQRSPDARFISIDISAESIATAKQKVDAAGLTNVKFEEADLFDLPYKPESFDHIFVCFVLEHLSRPCDALSILKRLLKPRGSITVIEGDHSSTFFYPDNPAAHAAIESLVKTQAQSGANALIGRELYPLMIETGFDDVRVSPRMVYVDGSRPELADAFTRKTFTTMIEGVRESAIAAGLIAPQYFDDGVKALYRSAEPDGVFCYTFFKAVATKS
jgi:ubiquinone/menaquinone biosynthesis C-methylase UbiE